MKARLIFHDKALLADGSIVEMIIWQLPNPSADRPHGLKYRLYFGRDGERIVCYDNERGKGNHRHLLGAETAYQFVSAEDLIADFLGDVETARRSME